MNLDVEQMLADQHAYDQEDLRRLLACYPDVTVGELLSYGEGVGLLQALRLHDAKVKSGN